MDWYTRLDEGVTALIPPVHRVAASPSGTYLAVFLTRASDPDLVRRERVYLIERATGREVVALDGPRIFRDFAWVDDESLLVVRDRARGSAAVTLHAIPDGGVVAEAHLTNTGGRAMTLQVSVDRRRVLVRPLWMLVQVNRLDAFVLALPSLTTLLGVDWTRFGDPYPPLDVSLSPEGTHVAIVVASELSVVTVDRPGAEPSVHRHPNDVFDASITWITEDRAWIIVDTEARPPRARSYAFDLADPAWTPLFAEGRSDEFPLDLCVDPDRARVAGLSKPRGRSEDDTGLVLMRAATGELATARRSGLLLGAVRWTRDGRSLVTVGARGSSLELHRWPDECGEPTRCADIACATPPPRAELALLDDSLALVSGGGAAWLVALRP